MPTSKKAIKKKKASTKKATGKKAAPKPKTNISCGASNRAGDNYVGMTIEAIEKKLKAVLNIPKDAKVSIDGKTARRNQKLKEGQRLEFQKEAGRHGV